MTRFLPALLACALFQLPAPASAAPADDSAPLFTDPVVATGKGFQIKRSQVDEAFINYSVSLAANGQSVPDALRATVRSNLLQRLIVNHLLLQMATEDDRLKSRQLADDRLARARSNAPSPQAFEEQIRAKGMTLEQLRDRMVEDLLSQRVLERQLTNGVTITDAQVKKFYDDHPTNFDIPEQVRVMHILISTVDPLTRQPLSPENKKEKLALARELKQRADKGEDFAALARQYSQDPGVTSNGGEYTFGRTSSIVPEFKAAAFTLKVNQISDPVETQFGYHLIKLLEKIPASRETFAKAETVIRDRLTERAAEDALPAYLEKLKAGAEIKILEPVEGQTAPAKIAPSPK
jgi:parvulin-like peptidyl-prolyl isomerase